MKKLKVKKGIECQACLSCLNACSETFYKEENVLKACLQVISKNGVAKPMICIQCGKCAEACPNDAIKQLPNGVYTVDKKSCVGCGNCVEACPMGVMILPKGEQIAAKCIACGKCVKACPMDMLEIVTD